MNPLRGQNNVQGACDMGALPNVFPGYQRVEDPALREKFEKAWGVKKLPEKNGLMLPQMMEGLIDGKIKVFYVFGENLANTEPDIKHVEHCLSSAEFLVCQDNFQTETTRFAHVILPAAAWSENEGTFTNSERRVSRVRTVKPPPGVAKPNWWIFKEIAKRMGQDWAASSAQEIWDNEISELVPQMAGIKYSRMEKNGLQWPVPSLEHLGTTVYTRMAFYLRLRQHYSGGLDSTGRGPRPGLSLCVKHRTAALPLSYQDSNRTVKGLNDLLSEETADSRPCRCQGPGY